MNRCVIKCAAGDLDPGECVESLNVAASRYAGFRCPTYSGR